MTPSPATSVLVFGITGNQGSSVATSLLDAGVKVVGLSRNPEGAKAKALASKGAMMIKGDLDHVETFAEALKDVEGVFLNLDFWQFYTDSNGEAAQAAEIKQGKAVVDAIAAAKVKHLVYSALERCNEPRVPIPHNEGNDEVKNYIRTLGLPATNIYTSYYFSNILSAPVTRKGDALVLENAMPDNTRIASFAVEQMGLWALAAFKDPGKWIGKDMHAVSQYLTVAEYAGILSATLNLKIVPEHHSLYAFFTNTTLDREWWLHMLAMVNGQIVRDVNASKAVVRAPWDLKTWILSTPAVKAKFEQV